METLASQYYAQIGIGNVARPMVVGDRLWLFSQSPANNVPARSMLNNNNNNNPLVSNRFHSFDNSPVVSMQNPTPPIQPVQMPMFPNYLPPCNFIPSSATDNVPNIAANYRADTLYSEYLSSQQGKHLTIPPNNFQKDYRSLTAGNYTAPNTSKSFLNKLFWSNGFANRPVIDNNGFDRLAFPSSDGFPNGYVGPTTDASGVSPKSSDYAKETTGIAELERVFGLNDKCKQQMFGIGPKADKVNEMKDNGVAGDCNDCYSDTSDVDCERL